MNAEALDAALDATAMSGSFIRSMRPEVHEDDVITKEDDSPVTIADLAAQVLIRLHLEEEAQVPAFPMCGEEGSQLLREPGSDRLRSRVLELVQSMKPSIKDAEMLALLDRGSHRPDPESDPTCWICDPIDGTKRYLSGHRYSSCLGLLVEGQLVCGAIACPDLGGAPHDPVDVADANGSLYGALHGGGAFLIADLPSGSAGRRTRLTLPRRDEENPVVRVARSVGSTGLKPEHVWAGLEANGALLEIVPIDNQCKYVALATDRVDCLYQHAGSPDAEAACIWDFAPGVLLAAEAGAEVLDRAGRPFDFNQGSHLRANRGLAANGPGIARFFSPVV
jgi:3'-phosphoadenosine 5'-phosphosulfate (PAPS) 3'-phosphatase